MSPRVIGWDLSIAATGTASPAGDLHTIPTKTEDGDRRLLTIEQYLLDSAAPLGRNAADFAVLEDLPRNANAAGVTGMVHGIARRILLEAGIPYVLVVPATLKLYATGNGHATKADMRMALYQRMGIDERDDNRVDAWWLRCMGLDWLGATPVRLPKAQREAMLRAAKKGAWPEVTP